MSTNNQLIITKIGLNYCIFENNCVDNEFKKPKINKNALFKNAMADKVVHWANKYCRENIVEYGIKYI